MGSASSPPPAGGTVLMATPSQGVRTDCGSAEADHCCRVLRRVLFEHRSSPSARRPARLLQMKLVQALSDLRVPRCGCGLKDLDVEQSRRRLVERFLGMIQAGESSRRSMQPCGPGRSQPRNQMRGKILVKPNGDESRGREGMRWSSRWRPCRIQQRHMRNRCAEGGLVRARRYRREGGMETLVAGVSHSGRPRRSQWPRSMPDNQSIAVPVMSRQSARKSRPKVHGIRIPIDPPSLPERQHAQALRGGGALNQHKRRARRFKPTGKAVLPERECRRCVSMQMPRVLLHPSTIHALPPALWAPRPPGKRCRAPCPWNPARRRRRAPGCAAARAARVGPWRFRPPARIRASTGGAEGSVRGGGHEVGFRGFAGSGEGRRPSHGAVTGVLARRDHAERSFVVRRRRLRLPMSPRTILMDTAPPRMVDVPGDRACAAELRRGTGTGHRRRRSFHLPSAAMERVPPIAVTRQGAARCASTSSRPRFDASGSTRSSCDGVWCL
ncbi:hypothetical protein DFJ74DRAFT_299745 [Hyaloraphidium curvatum]|nr:hypothetical protein DFJ74DRAFT_299745 [Hyaloraphidium curvatum]